MFWGCLGVVVAEVIRQISLQARVCVLFKASSGFDVRFDLEFIPGLHSELLNSQLEILGNGRKIRAFEAWVLLNEKCT